MEDINIIIDKQRNKIDYIDSYIAKLRIDRDKAKQEIARLTKDKVHCSGCGNYFDGNRDNTRTEISTNYECVYRDCGYGDNDLYADVKYRVDYCKCPYCGNETEKSKQYISEGPSFDRWGNKV